MTDITSDTTSALDPNLPFSTSDSSRARDGIALVYCDWSQQDWCPVDHPVTEKMIVDTAAVFRRWRDVFGFAFDTYLVDVFWFDQERGYTTWDRKQFPNGPERSLQAIREAGMQLGLWYCNGHHNVLPRPDAYAPSRDSTGYAYVVSAGPYREALLAAWEKAYREWGMRMVKFDFASLDATLPDDPQPERRPALNQAAFRELLRTFKLKHPDTRFLLYNGFDAASAGSTLEDPAQTTAISSEWADYCDWSYCGDTRPSDLPSLRLRRSCEIYNDHQVKRWYWAGFPLDKIDESGCYIGTGGSWYELGRTDFRSSWLLMLMRGANKAMLYGDPAPLPDADVQWMQATYERANALVRRGARVTLLGGWPALAQPYGYRLARGEDGLAVAVNPTWQRATLRIPTCGRAEAKCLASDSGTLLPVHADVTGVAVELPPNQMVLVGLGAEAAKPLPDTRLTEGDWPTGLTPLTVHVEDGGGTFHAEVDAGADVTWLLRFWRDGERHRVCLPWRGGGQLIQDYLGLEAGACDAVAHFHDRPFWSGMSYWVLTQYNVAAEGARVAAAPPDAALTLTAEAFQRHHE